MEKTQYLAIMFNRRTQNKKYENYIINAIYTLIGNKELIPVTQQFVQTNRGKDAFLDLYFPQINYGIEIDEGHHLNKVNEWDDKEREKAIYSAIKCEEGRIRVYKKSGEIRKHEDIYKDILEEVKKIKGKIQEVEKGGNKLRWEDNDSLKENIFKRGYFDIKDQADYKGPTEIYKEIMKKNPPQKCHLELNEKYWLWVPFLAIKLKDGTVKTKNGWENTINEDMTEIVEVPKDKNERKDTKDLKTGPWNDNGILRVVFMQIKDRFGMERKKFLGVFEAYKVENKGEKQYRHYRRIAETFDFKKLLSASNKKSRKIK